MISHSSPNPFSEPEGCGQQLRKAREAAGLSVDEVASKLHMAPHVIRSLEAQNWACLGAPVFVRGQLRSYASFLKLNPNLIVQQARIGHIEPPVLLARRQPLPRARQWFESLLRKGVYATITAAFAIPVWFATNHHLQHKALNAAALDTPAVKVVDAPSPSTSLAPSSQPPVNPRISGGQGVPSSGSADLEVAPAPYVASMTPMLPTKDKSEEVQPDTVVAAAAPDHSGDEDPAADAINDLVLNFNGDSWLEAVSPTGQALTKTLVHSGEQRRYPLSQVGHIVIGNIESVEVEHAGVTLDLSAFRHGNVARFSIGPDGQPY